MYVVQRLDGVKVSRFLLPMTGPFLASAVMVAAVLATRSTVAGLSPLVQLLIEICVGGIVYVAAALVLARSTFLDIFTLLRSALHRG